MKLAEFHRDKPETVVLFTGYMLGTWTFRPMIKAMPDWHIMAFEDIGSGGAFCEGRSYIAAIDAVASLLKDRGIDRIQLAGHSMGGFVAQEFAVRYPELLGSLILMGSCHLDAFQASHRVNALPVHDSLFNLSEAEFFTFATNNIFSPFFLADTQSRQRLWYDFYRFPPNRETCRDQLYMLEELYRTGGQTVARGLNCMAIFGEDDLIVAADWVRKLARYYDPAPRFTAIKSSHMFMYEDPAACADHLNTWCTEMNVNSQ